MLATMRRFPRYFTMPITITSTSNFFCFLSKHWQSFNELMLFQRKLRGLFRICQIKWDYTSVWIINYLTWSLVWLGFLIVDMIIGCYCFSSVILWVTLIFFHQFKICFRKRIKMLVCILNCIIKNTWCVWKLVSQC